MASRAGRQRQFRFDDSRKAWESMPPEVHSKVGELLRQMYLAWFRAELVQGVRPGEQRENHL